MVSIDDALMKVPSTKDPKNVFDGKYKRCSNEGTIDQIRNFYCMVSMDDALMNAPSIKDLQMLFDGKCRRCSNEGAIYQRSEKSIR